MNNAEIMGELLKSYFEVQRGNVGKRELGGGEMNTFRSCKKEEPNEQIFMTAKSFLQRLTEVAVNYARVCDGKLEMKKITMKGHVAAMNMKCSVTKNHNMLWSSSPYLPDNVPCEQKGLSWVYMQWYVARTLCSIHKWRWLRKARHPKAKPIFQKHETNC